MLTSLQTGRYLGAKRTLLHGAPYMIALKSGAGCRSGHGSDVFRNRFHNSIPSAWPHVPAGPFSHDNVFHCTLGMLNVSSGYNPALACPGLLPCRTVTYGVF